MYYEDFKTLLIIVFIIFMISKFTCKYLDKYNIPYKEGGSPWTAYQ